MATVQVEVDGKVLEVGEDKPKMAHLYTGRSIYRHDHHGKPAVALCGYIRESDRPFEDWGPDKDAKFCPTCFAIEMELKL